MDLENLTSSACAKFKTAISDLERTMETTIKEMQESYEAKCKEMQESYEYQLQAKCKEMEEVKGSYESQLQAKCKEMEEVKGSYESQLQAKCKEMEEVKAISYAEIFGKDDEIQNLKSRNERLTEELSSLKSKSNSPSKRQRSDEIQNFEPGSDSNQNSANLETPHSTHRTKTLSSYQIIQNSNNPPRKSVSLPNIPKRTKSNLHWKTCKVTGHWLSMCLYEEYEKSTHFCRHIGNLQETMQKCYPQNKYITHGNIKEILEKNLNQKPKQENGISFYFQYFKGTPKNKKDVTIKITCKMNGKFEEDFDIFLSPVQHSN